jgi:hypothetical protein
MFPKAYYKAELKSNSDKASSCLRQFGIGNASDKCVPISGVLSLSQTYGHIHSCLLTCGPQRYKLSQFIEMLWQSLLKMLLN